MPRDFTPAIDCTNEQRQAIALQPVTSNQIAAIGMRMLQPRELYRAQGFPDTYIIDRGADGRSLPKDAQVRMCGNSVCPPLARALVEANYSERFAQKEAA